MKFDEPRLVRKLSQMPVSYRAAFSLCCATRQLITWNEYSKRFNKEKQNLMFQIVEQIWQSIDSNVVPMKWDIILDEVTALFPEAQNQWAPFHVYAEDAIASLAYTIRCLKDSSSQEAAWAARRAYEASDQAAIRDLNIQNEMPSSESQILSHPIVQRELSRQERDFQMLSTSATSNILKILQFNAFNESVLSLDDILK